MARLFPLLLAAVLAAVLAASLAYAPKPVANLEQVVSKPGADATMPAGTPEAPETKGSGQPVAKAANPVQSASRDVGSGMVASPVAPGTVLERIEPVAPPAEVEEPAPRNTLSSDAQKRWRVVFNSVITAAGVFDLNGMSIVLPGIDVVTADEKCTTIDGRSWPCGMAARSAFRAYVRNRALNCHLPLSRPDKAIVAECLLSGADPAEWLVAQGWARASPGSAYEGLGKTARETTRGIFGSPPTGVGVGAGGAKEFVPEALFDESLLR
jgi:endonuclease YncB( thermonuclease family)